MIKNKPLILLGQTIEPGEKRTLILPSPELYTQTKIEIPVHVFHGKYAGPKLFVIGTLHGDELNSIEIIRRLHTSMTLKYLRGTLITIPIANVYGLITRSRYLPDRRDLNRSFPGSKSGSLAARLANVLIEEIVTICNYGIDLHTGAFGRVNMPQLRVNLDTPGAGKLARAFNVPVILDAKIRDGSLREAASELAIPLLVYEGGEALRLNEWSIRVGLSGIINVLNALNMFTIKLRKKSHKNKPVIIKTSRWVRASASGLVQPLIEIAKTVKEGTKLAYIHDPFMINKSEIITAPFDGILIGQSNLPLVNEGDALYNIASTKALADVAASIEELQDDMFN